jgi:hypothetical protein
VPPRQWRWRLPRDRPQLGSEASLVGLGPQPRHNDLLALCSSYRTGYTCMLPSVDGPAIDRRLLGRNGLNRGIRTPSTEALIVVRFGEPHHTLFTTICARVYEGSQTGKADGSSGEPPGLQGDDNVESRPVHGTSPAEWNGSDIRIKS